jgi:type IV pilus assembly protein PilP
MDTLRMVGILEQNDQTWGLIKDPQNVVHRVQVGNYAGQNEGQIVSVSEDKIELIEIIPDGLGGYIERNATLGIGDQ